MSQRPRRHQIEDPEDIARRYINQGKDPEYIKKLFIDDFIGKIKLCIILYHFVCILQPISLQ